MPLWKGVYVYEVYHGSGEGDAGFKLNNRPWRSTFFSRVPRLQDRPNPSERNGYVHNKTTDKTLKNGESANQNRPHSTFVRHLKKEASSIHTRENKEKNRNHYRDISPTITGVRVFRTAVQKIYSSVSYGHTPTASSTKQKEQQRTRRHIHTYVDMWQSTVRTTHVPKRYKAKTKCKMDLETHRID